MASGGGKPRQGRAEGEGLAAAWKQWVAGVPPCRPVWQSYDKVLKLHVCHNLRLCRGHAAALPAAVRTPPRPRWGRV